MRRRSQQSPGIRSLIVQKSDPQVLQDFLAKRLSLSRRAAKTMIDQRTTWVNRKCVWIAGFALRVGDTVEVAQAAIVKPRPRFDGGSHIRVLWQDDSYLVCDKPFGVLSCDDPKSAETILREQEGVPTLEAVHRLDRDTTGCLMFAKNHAALEAAIEVFKSHKVSKTYHAIVIGKFNYAYQTIDAALDGQEAVSKVAREAIGDDASFLRVRIETGRTNQIRRHLASVRHPIIGDRVFGLKSARDPRLMQVARQMLHASTLVMPNPMVRGAELRVHSPLPADFRATLRLFGMGKR